MFNPGATVKKRGKWFPTYSDELWSPKEDELIRRFHSAGYMFRDRLMKLCRHHLNPHEEYWYRFKFTINYFRTILLRSSRLSFGKACEIMGYLEEYGELIYKIENDKIIIDHRELENRMTAYVKRAKDREEEEEDET